VTTVSGTAFAALAVALARFVLPPSVPLLLVLFVVLAELLFARLLDVSAMAFQAIEQLHITAWFVFGLTCFRLFAAAILLFGVPHANALDWSGLYLLSTIGPSVLAVIIVSRRIGRPALAGIRGRDLLQGTYFSISQSAQTIYNDIDKTMLARISGVGATGIYGAAYRIVDAGFTPVSSVLAAAYARFFQHGALGLRPAVTYGRAILRPAIVYSVLAAGALWLAAPLVPLFAGREFAESVVALRLLSPLILLRSAHCLAADSLTGSGHQRTRTAAQIFVAVLNIGLNLIILPRHSWRGAVCTSLISDAALAATLWTLVWRLCAHETKRVEAIPVTVLEA
jgi:O-antigen/teichoic acid export membrane protein